MRHFRTQRELTLTDLAQQVGAGVSQLSLLENGRREPRVSLLRSLADALSRTRSPSCSPTSPRRTGGPPWRSQLDRAQRSDLFLRPGDQAGTARAQRAARRPRVARRAAHASSPAGRTRRTRPRRRRGGPTPRSAGRCARADNYLPELEELGEKLIRKAGYRGGALTHRTVGRLAEQLGFAIIHVEDLPHSTRTVTDLENGRIYLPPASIPGGHGLRSLALQAIAHRVLGHERPASYADFLRQRLEINYFAAVCLMPRTAAVEFLSRPPRRRKTLLSRTSAMRSASPTRPQPTG